MPPKIHKSTQKMYKVNKTDDVEVTVKFAASPKPSDEWTVNGNVVQKSNRISTTINDESATLTIKKIEDDDVGEYTLRLSNTYGETSINIKVIIVGVYLITNILKVLCKTFFFHFKITD